MGSELEPGQDDLVKEDHASVNMLRKAKQLAQKDSEEALYTDHKVQTPSHLTPEAELDPTIERRSGSPVHSSILERLRTGVTKVSDVFGRQRAKREIAKSMPRRTRG